MNYPSILKNIEKHISLTEEEQHYFYSLLTVRHVSRNERILDQGKISKFINFVDSGILRAYHINHDGKDSTIMFAVTDWWITDMYSFVNQIPALLAIEALEDSVILQLNYTQLELLYREIPTFERFFRILMQNAYIREQLRVLDAISLSTEERYHKFTSKYHGFVPRVSQKQIASYLGVTPEFLSTILRKKFHS
jgi:CRP-like cAMP-binding protein